MKKGLLLILLIFPLYVFAQLPLPNGGFEAWDNIGAATEEPVSWNSNKTGTGLAATPGQTCFREATEKHSGSYSVRIRTTTYFGTPVNGVCTIGKVNAPSFTPSDGYNNTLTTDTLFNHVINSVPDSIVFWAKYVPQDGTDSARVSAVIHDSYNVRDPQDGASVPHIRSKAVKNFRTGGTWIRMSLPFTTTNAGVTPQYVLITFTASKTPGVGTNNTILYVDDAALIYNPVITTGTISPLLYHVTASSGASVSVPYTATGTFVAGNIFTAQLSNSAGSFASPVNIGTIASTTSGTIAATIPAGTPTGSGYRIRVVSSTPPLNGSNNGADIQINLVGNSIAPTASQTIEAGVNGTTLNVTETGPASVSKEWKYATISGGPYSSFSPAQTGTSYTPNFPTAGTYYVICESSYSGGFTLKTNEVIINVVDNAVTPSGSQSILVGVNGTTLNVTETPAGTAREWKYAMAPGGPYVSFSPVQTGMSYIPNFAAAGTYYVVCVSTVSGIPVTSNEVLISVSSITLSTGSIAGSPFEFSPSAPNASVSVPFTVSGGSFLAGNVFTAQLSDASGSFTSPVNIGTVSGTGSGTISATILNTTPAGTGYRIRVTASSPAVLGADNGTDLVVDQFTNAVAPTATQTIQYNTNGTAVSVTGSQAITSNEWQYSTNPGGPYTAFSPAQTGTSYTPNFPTIDTFYVVCISENTYGDPVTSNEIMIITTNGTNINTSALATSTFYLSPNAVVQPVVNFTSDIIFNAGNTFTAQLSDASGSFALPVTIGTLPGSSVGPITTTIPNGTLNGSGYRIRVISSDPAATGTDNGTNLTAVQLQANAAPADTQDIPTNANGATITATSTHPSVTYEWKYRVTLGPYSPFSPAETGSTYVPNFSTSGSKYVICYTVNTWGDTATTEEIVINVSESGAGIDDENGGTVSTYWSHDQLVIDLTHSKMQNPKLELMNMHGQVIANAVLQNQGQNVLSFTIPAGMYIYRLTDGKISSEGKFVKP